MMNEESEAANDFRIDLVQKKNDRREYDEHGNALMTSKYIKHLCRVHGLYTVAELNDKLFLHYQGPWLQFLVL